MECRDAEKLVLKFIQGNCSKEEARQLVSHIRTCESCWEEISIQFLLEEGLHRLEAGESFDLNQELNARVEEVEKSNRYQFNIKVFGITLFYVLIIILVLILIWFLWPR